MANFDWFRMHSEARNDRKLAVLTADQFRVWFNLLCFANEQKERGTFEVDDMELLALEVTGGDEDLLAETLARLQKLKMLVQEGTTCAFVNWDKRQYDKPSAKPDAVRARVAKSRENKREAVRPEGENDYSTSVQTVTSEDVTPCNAEVTPVLHPVTHRAEQSRTEKSRIEESRTDKSREEVTPQPELVTPEISASGVPAAADLATLNFSVSALLDGADLARRLMAEGVNKADAERLAREKPDECRRQLEFLPFVQKFRTSKGAWLRSAVEGKYGPPPGYQSAKPAVAVPGAGNEKNPEEVIRAQKQHLHGIDPSLWPDLEKRAKQRQKMNWISADLLCSTMRRVYQDDLRRQAERESALTGATVH